MKWDEDQIRESLKRLDGVDVPTKIPTTTLARARSRRLVSLGITVLVTLIVGAAAAGGALSIDRENPNRLVGPPPAPSLVRLVTDPTGLIEIEASKGQACYRFEVRGATSAHIHEQGSSEVLVDLPIKQAGNSEFLGCADRLDAAALQAIVERPGDHLVEFHNSDSGGTETATLSADVGRPDCLPTELTSPEYGLHFPAREGRPGDQIAVWGTTLRTEAGGYAPSDRLELWWNAEAPDENRPKKDGEAIQLASVSTGNRCYFLTSITVPDVPDGQYEVTGFVWEEPPSEGYGIFIGTDFTVASASSGLPPCDDDQSYGRTIPGRWLEDVILSLGAPGSYEVTNKEVGDTGTALSIDIPQYDNDPSIYATMLTPGDDPNITSSPPEEEVGKHGGYTLYLQDGNPWQTYKAVSADWQLSLIAYPGADNEQIAWPDGTLEWLTQAAKIAQVSPPECSGPLN